MTLADMSRATGLTRATARRLLHTLVALGFVCTDGRTFELTPRVLDLGFAYVSSLQLPDIAQPFMEGLSDRVHESVSASVLDGDQIVYVARVNTQRIMGISLAIGSRLPAAWTSMGRVLLAGLTDEQLDTFFDGLIVTELTMQSITDIDALRAEVLAVRSQGYALIDQELEVGIRSVAAPLRDRRGRTLAAINVGDARGAGDPEGTARRHPSRPARHGPQHREPVGQAMSRPAHPLIGRVEVLVDQLRRRGIDVTTGAVIDAFTALMHLPLEEPESVKAGLRATLVKSSDPTGEFDRAFRAVFAGLAGGGWTEEITDVSEEVPAIPTPGQLSSALLNAMQQGDEAQIALAGPAGSGSTRRLRRRRRAQRAVLPAQGHARDRSVANAQCGDAATAP